MTIMRHSLSKSENRDYPCIPGSAFISTYFVFGELISLAMAYYSAADGAIGPSRFFIGFSVALFAFIVWQWKRTMWKVRIDKRYLTCYAPLCNKIVISLDDCRVGFGYHLQGKTRVWWIYLCDPLSRFDTRSICDHMNSLKCEESFVRIMYRQDFFEELIDHLPKKQKETLLSEKRFYKIDNINCSN